jgi:hypothetical protein
MFNLFGSLVRVKLEAEKAPIRYTLKRASLKKSAEYIDTHYFDFYPESRWKNRVIRSLDNPQKPKNPSKKKRQFLKLLKAGLIEPRNDGRRNNHGSHSTGGRNYSGHAIHSTGGRNYSGHAIQHTPGKYYPRNHQHQNQR